MPFKKRKFNRFRSINILHNMIHNYLYSSHINTNVTGSTDTTIFKSKQKNIPYEKK